jgi:hypothetical protein
MLEGLDGVRVLTPANRQASLVNFLPVGWSPARMAGLVDALTERGFVIRSIPHAPYCVRVSCGFYNTEAEIDGLGAALADLLAAGPGAIPVPEWAAPTGFRRRSGKEGPRRAGLPRRGQRTEKQKHPDNARREANRGH